ncbi:MAG: LysR family transcriptional regulator [Rhizobiaceae bacterium]|nr:LysR family transcriptional regulator [Rhizobiaceae bacterium]MCV0405630.1 LysR family transcriptional regulator [Rhizobiaceae bacterium]
MMGPGKAELLERIAATGSIPAAGRAKGMSYKRAWSLVETMNALFAEPVVTSTRGGARGGWVLDELRSLWSDMSGRRLPRDTSSGDIPGNLYRSEDK